MTFLLREMSKFSFWLMIEYYFYQLEDRVRLYLETDQNEGLTWFDYVRQSVTTVSLRDWTLSLKNEVIFFVTFNFYDAILWACLSFALIFLVFLSFELVKEFTIIFLLWYVDKILSSQDCLFKMIYCDSLMACVIFFALCVHSYGPCDFCDDFCHQWDLRFVTILVLSLSKVPNNFYKVIDTFH